MFATMELEWCFGEIVCMDVRAVGRLKECSGVEYGGEVVCSGDTDELMMSVLCLNLWRHRVSKYVFT